MGKKIIVAAALAISMTATAAMAVGGVSDSKHNLSMYGVDAASNTSEVCVFCHTPHQAQVAKPLWNRINGDATGYVLYSSSSMKNIPYKSGLTPDSMSLLCISCHDGTAIGANVANKPKDIGTNPLIVQSAGSSNITNDRINNTKTNFGTNLSKHHPINFNVTLNGFQYALGDVDDATHEISTGNGGGYKLPLFKSARGPNSLECSSCHDAHNQGESFLRAPGMMASNLCLTCHIK
jgi:predicted CXXCH cytochrome family protein